jgi:hypothetical protein
MPEAHMIAINGIYDGKKLTLNKKVRFTSPTEVVLVIKDKNEPATGKRAKYDFASLAGKLKWQGDALKTQKDIRNEW